jgi:hypothetical protein
MAIDDAFIKKNILAYQTSRSSLVLNDIIAHLSNYIYHYPRKIFLLDHDKAIDFYIYYLERIEKIILKYTPIDVKFITWFTYTLKNSYLNYIDMKKRKDKDIKQELSFDKYLDPYASLTLYDIVASKNDSNNDYIKNISNDILEYINKIYNDRDITIFALHNLELFISHIINILMNYFNISYEDSCRICENARATYLSKYNEIIKYQDRITNINIKIEELKSKNKSIESLVYKKECYKNRLDNIRLVVPYCFLSGVFEASKNIITKVINKIKLELKNNFNIDNKDLA